MATPKRDCTWFERKVGELGKAVEQLPRERHLELFTELEQESTQRQPHHRKGELKGGRPVK